MGILSVSACSSSKGRPGATSTASEDGGDAAAMDSAADAFTADAAADASGDEAALSDSPIGDAGPSGPPSAMFSTTSIDFGSTSCGASSATSTLNISNTGGAPLVAAASVVGSAFALTSSNSITVAPGGSGSFTLTATVQQAATPGTALSGSLAVFTNDPSNANRILPLSVTPSGATLTGNALYVLPSTEVGVSSTPVPFHVTNRGNAAGSFVIGAPNVSAFSFSPSPPAGGIMLAPGQSYDSTVSFKPTSAVSAASQVAITSTSTLCGVSLSAVLLQGAAAQGQVVGWPSDDRVDFGFASCGGAAPPAKKVTLRNINPNVPARVTLVDTSGMNGFTTDVTTGTVMNPGAYLAINFNAPPVPQTSTLGLVTGTLRFQTDADAAPIVITLSEAPSGAVLAFNTAATQNFGSFGTEILLQSSTQSFAVTNAGNAPANVTLVASENQAGPPDAGLADAGGAPGAFLVAVPAFTLSGSQSSQQESLTFRPVHANATVGSLMLTVDSSTAVCGALPSPLPLTGNASGAGPVVAPSALTFGATCGGAAPSAQSFVLANSGTVNMSWTMGAVTGRGAGYYTVQTSAQPGLLIPGASVTVTVSPSAIPSPAPSTNPADYAASIAIDTDVPFDPTHVVALGEVPLGDQLSVSAGNLRFGQVPLGTSLGQSFGIMNSANPGSPGAQVHLQVVAGSDAGSAPYTVPATASVAPGSSSSVAVGFDATQAAAYPATLVVQTSDALCTPLPAPIVLSGTGTHGRLALSATTLAFGTDPNDPLGLVRCGGTGSSRQLSLSNVGNQSFNVTAVALAKGAGSPFLLSGAASHVPLPLAIGAGSTLTIAPKAIPATVTDPNDASAYSDILTVSTDAPGDTPRTVALVMQPYGVVIAPGTAPQTAWSFGMIGAGSIGTYSNTIQNTGNAPATVSLTGLSLPSVFGLENNPVTVPPASVVELLGQFTPPSQNGIWTDQGQLVVSAPSAFCQPLPQGWVTPTVTLSGASNANPAVTLSGDAVFPTTDCGAGPPGGRSVTLHNSTNAPFAYTVAFGSGEHYTFTDPSAGVLAASGSSSIVVNPKTVTPGPGVVPGSAPYADQLLLQVTPVGGDAGVAPMSFTVPVSWTLNGAVFSLPDGTGPSGQGFYVADSTSGFALRMGNSGNGTASVSFSIQPAGMFSVQPAPPIQVIPSVGALPGLLSGGSAPACPSTATGVTPNATATFVYSGPVCQPFGVSGVSVFACSGAYP